ncbi:MAG TPA: efflux RND transporter periplasmic adaptor subunit, partial [Candidatus Binatia bacterium]
MTRRALSLFIIPVMLVVTAVVVYFIQAVEEPAPAESEPVPVPVEVTVVEPRPFTHYLEALGSVEPVRDAEVGPQVSGPVRLIPKEVELGASVEQGALLAEIDPAPFEIEVNHSAALVARAQAGVRAREVEVGRQRDLIPINQEKLRLTRAEQRRLQELLEKDLIAKQDVERAELAMRRVEEEAKRTESGLREAEVQLAVAQADLAAAEADLARAKKSLADTRVRAPFAGIISEKKVTLGEQVNPGTVLFRLAEIDQVKLLVRIPPEDIAFLRTGMEADVTISVAPTALPGRVAHIGPRADPETRSFPVEVLVTNRADAQLLPGMFARARIPVRTYPEAILIPRSSVLSLSGKTIAFVANSDSGAAELKRVTVGRTFGSRHL